MTAATSGKTPEAASPAKTLRKRAPKAGQDGPKTGQNTPKAVQGAPKPPRKGVKRAPARRNAVRSVGERLRVDLEKPNDTVAMTLRIRQAIRCAERLDQLDALLSGRADAWVKVSIPRSDAGRGRVYVDVKVDDLVREERAQSKLFRELLDGIERARSGDTKAPPGPKAKDVLEVDE